jgi:hypothetical protein
MAGLRNEMIQMATHPSADGEVSTAVSAADHGAPRADHATADGPEGWAPSFEAETSPNFAAKKPTLEDLQAQVEALKKAVAALNRLLKGVTRENRTLRFSGLNLQIVNGTKATHGTPNAVGNLIIGYNAPRDGTTAADRAGSHSLVIGDKHHWTSYGHLLAGAENTATGASAAVSGGYRNTASQPQTSVTGGTFNFAEATAATVSGGVGNVASGGGASVSGGHANKAGGGHASVSGGDNNTASGTETWIAGGKDNTAKGDGSSIVGGKGVTTWAHGACHSC